MFESIITVIKDHMGVGFVSVLFVLSLAYLLLKEKNPVRRCLLVYAPILILAFFMCPISYRVYGEFSESITYYRLLWLIPVTPVIAYTAVCICFSFSGKRQNLCIALAAIILAASGRLMYSDMYMIRAANIYHMPVQVVDICDALHVDGREVMVLMPYEFQQFVRQYDPCIMIPYGREYMMNVSQEENALRDAMMKEERDPYEIGCLATIRGCHYIVVPPNERFDVLPENYAEYMTIDGYIIYKNVLLSTEVGKIVND